VGDSVTGIMPPTRRLDEKRRGAATAGAGAISVACSADSVTGTTLECCSRAARFLAQTQATTPRSSKTAVGVSTATAMVRPVDRPPGAEGGGRMGGGSDGGGGGGVGGGIGGGGEGSGGEGGGGATARGMTTPTCTVGAAADCTLTPVAPAAASWLEMLAGGRAVKLAAAAWIAAAVADGALASLPPASPLPTSPCGMVISTST